MILQALKGYYDQLTESGDSVVPQYGFGRQKIHFCLVIGRDGSLRDVQDLRTAIKKRMVPVELIVPEPVKRTSDIAANFLWDNTGYVLGWDDKGNEERAAKMFQAFKEHQHRVGDKLKDEGMIAVLRFLEHWVPSSAHKLPYWEEAAGGNLVFRLEGEHEYVHERPQVQATWLQYYRTMTSKITGTCLVTGKVSPISRLHPPIKGVAGAQSSGAALISFNLDAFTSYGKDQNYNAPVGEEAAFAYCTALNWMLRNDSRQKIRIADTTIVFWAERRTVAETLVAGLLDPEIEVSKWVQDDHAPVRDLRIILEAARDGRIQDVVTEPDVPFYILGLSPNASRLAVRFWHVSTVGAVVGNIGKHFRDMAIVKNFENDPDYPSIRRLLRETATQGKSENISPLLAGALLRSVLTGGPYPQNLLAAVLLRIRADHRVNKVRAGLIKACLSRNHNMKEVGMSLDSNNTDIGYRLGRLFAVLERIQERANPNISSTIRDKYFGSAAATPRNIFPMLVNLAQQHLGKLRRDSASKGSARFLDSKIEEIVSGLNAAPLPAFLDPEKQGLFTLGYYHQRHDLFAGKPKTSEQNEEE